MNSETGRQSGKEKTEYEGSSVRHGHNLLDIENLFFLSRIFGIMVDDCFVVNIRKDREQIYFGYENEVPDAIKSFKITEIYIDWASEALGIHVSEE